MANLEDRLTLAAFNSLGNEPGTCKLVWGTYTGTGEYGSAHPTVLTFEGWPLHVWVLAEESDHTKEEMNISPFDDTASVYFGPSPSTVKVSWNGNSVSWYSEIAYNIQLNSPGRIYRYVALICT